LNSTRITVANNNDAEHVIRIAVHVLYCTQQQHCPTQVINTTHWKPNQKKMPNSTTTPVIGDTTDGNRITVYGVNPRNNLLVGDT